MKQGQHHGSGDSYSAPDFREHSVARTFASQVLIRFVAGLAVAIYLGLVAATRDWVSSAVLVAVGMTASLFSAGLALAVLLSIIAFMDRSENAPLNLRGWPFVVTGVLGCLSAGAVVLAMSRIALLR